jgi:hypothetical protein
MPVDPWGSGIYADSYNYDSPYYPDDNPSWWDLAQQAIEEGARTAQIVASGYPPGSTVVYAPQYPGGPAVPTIQAPPSGQYPMPMPMPGQAPAPSGGGVNFSNTTLMLLVGGVLLFMLGTKKGR